MRVALLSPYADPVKGGISSYTRELDRAYRELGIDVLSLSTDGGNGIPFEQLGPSKIAFILRVTVRLLVWNADLIHAHSHWYTLLPGIVLKKLRPRTRLLFSFHTPAMADSTNWKARLFLRLIGHCDAVAYVSREMMTTLSLPQSIPQAVVLAAPERRAVEFATMRPADRETTIVFIGPLVWPGKVNGVLLLLEAFARISSQFPEWRLVLIGDGPMRPRVDRRVHELRIDERVVLRGSVDDVFPELASAGLYAQISFQEGLPLSLLNAMALGAPVLATAVGGMAEVIEHGITGYLCGPDSDSVVSALKTMLSNRTLRSSMGSAARMRVTRDLTWSRVAENCIAVASRGVQ